MRILKWYVLKEFIPPYLGSMAFFSMLLLLERVLSFIRLVAAGYASIIDLLVLVFFSFPPTFALTMPMSTIMGALVSVSRLSHDSEITAMRASGIRMSSIFLSLYVAGVLIGGASYYLTDRLVPLGNLKFRTLYQKITIAQPTVQVDEHSVSRLTGDVMLMVNEVDEKTGDLIDVTIFEAEKGAYEKTITAGKGRFLTKDTDAPYIQLRLLNGSILNPRDKTRNEFNATFFQSLDLNIPVETNEIKNIVKTPRDMNLREIEQHLQKEEEGSRTSNTYLVEYHKRIAIPFACVLFVFLGTPFAVTQGRSGRGLGLGIGILIIFFYYLFLLLMERVGKTGQIPPPLAVWMPNIVFAVVGIANLVRKGRI
jgi:LPS export ABC transporter permease LptG